MENILITGSGFLSCAVARLNLPGNVFMLSRSPPKDHDVRAMIDQGTLRFIQHDIRVDIAEHPPSGVLASLPPIHCLIHLAAAMPEFHTSDLYTIVRENVHTNILGTTNLLNALPYLRYICFASSVSVYGPQQTPITEAQHPEPETIYGMSKLVAEKILQKHTDGKIPLTILRFSAIYGQGEPHNMFLTRMIHDAKKGKINLINEGEDVRDVLFIDDAARAIACAIEKKKDGIFNISSGQGISIRNYADLIATYCPAKIIYTSTAQKRSTPTSLIYNNEKARRHLDFTPRINIKEGLHRTVNA